MNGVDSNFYLGHPANSADGGLGLDIFHSNPVRCQGCSETWVQAEKTGNYIGGATVAMMALPAALEIGGVAGAAGRTALQEALSSVENASLRNVVRALYQSTDQIPGGTAGAIRNHLQTGQWILRNSGHFIKAAERITQLERLIAAGGLSAGDMAIAKAILWDLRNALGR